MNKEVSVLLETLHPLERKVLPVLKQNISLKEIILLTDLQEVEVMRALQWLENKNIIKINSVPKQLVSLDKNGLLYLEKGLPEKRFLKLLEKPLTIDEIKKKSDLNKEEFQISLGVLKKKAAIIINNKVSITDQGKKLLERDSLEEQFLKKLSKPLDLSKLTDEEKFAYNELKTRKQIIKTELLKDRTMQLTDLALQLQKQKIETKNIVDTLTPEIIKQKTWKNKTFRRYDIKINVPKIYPAKKHPMTQAIEYMRRIWLDMGFKEMTGNIIQTSFWNFDALFVPQDHPARDLQDTLFIKKPEKGYLPKKELVKKISETHKNGWTTGSKGWGYDWKRKEAQLNLLRTHTTVLSAQVISRLKYNDLPCKFFSIGKVFRNEALDWSHLSEFYQSEGIVVDENVNFKNLLGYLKEFFKKMGFEKIRFRPGYFPYTENSIEPEVFHPINKKWIELGGAGIFRPEVVKPLLGKDIPVLAWGLGIERIVSLYYEINDLRDLYENDIKKLREFKSFIP